jgi:hypothetical protein
MVRTRVSTAGIVAADHDAEQASSNNQPKLGNTLYVPARG